MNLLGGGGGGMLQPLEIQWQSPHLPEATFRNSRPNFSVERIATILSHEVCSR